MRRRKELRKAIGQHVRYVRRNLGNLEKLIKSYNLSLLNHRYAEYLDTIRIIYVQQMEMYIGRIHRVTESNVSLHKLYVRPKVSGKEQANVDFGSKINVSLVNGYSFID